MTDKQPNLHEPLEAGDLEAKVKNLDKEKEFLPLLPYSIEKTIEEIKGSPDVEKARQTYKKFKAQAYHLECRMDNLTHAIDEFMQTKYQTPQPEPWMLNMWNPS